MTSYQIIEFLDSLPKEGMIEIHHKEAGEIYVVSSTASYEAVGDDGLRVTASLGYGMIATVPSSLLLEADGISSIRHTRGTLD